MKARRRSGLPGQRRRAASDRGSDAALGHGSRNGGEAGEASGQAIGVACVVRRRSASDTGSRWRGSDGRCGGAARTRETALSERGPASTYPRSARPDSATHGSQPEHGAGRQCH
jgi:hypothetical protein